MELISIQWLYLQYPFCKYPLFPKKLNWAFFLNEPSHFSDILIVEFPGYLQEIARPETSHINLSEGKIYIPSGRNSNSRTLKLQANQILPIKTYLEEIRPALLEKRDLQTSLLFPSKKSSDMVCKIVEAVKRIHPGLKDSRQIRASVIMNWLKTNNIRQVQYMAGHKSIRSTESYRGQDLTDLTKQLELFHPLR